MPYIILLISRHDLNTMKVSIFTEKADVTGYLAIFDKNCQLPKIFIFSKKLTLAIFFEKMKILAIFF